jgi:hypothetical protein
MEPVIRTKLKAAELDAAIMKRLGDNPDCAGIIQVYVYVKATGHLPPVRDVGAFAGVSASGNPSDFQRNPAMLAILNECEKRSTWCRIER